MAVSKRRSLLHFAAMLFLLCLAPFLGGAAAEEEETKSEQMLQRIDFRPVELDHDLMDFPVVPGSIALNEDGYVAFACDEAAHHYVALRAPQGKVTYYTFETYGSYSVDLTADELVLGMVRDDHELRYGLSTGTVRLVPIDSSTVSRLYSQRRERSDLQNAAWHLTRETMGGRYILRLNEKVILQCSRLAMALSYLPFLFAVLIPLSAVVLLIKQLRKQAVS